MAYISHGPKLMVTVVENVLARPLKGEQNCGGFAKGDAVTWLLLCGSILFGAVCCS